MSTYLISYDLNAPGQDYTELKKAIRSLSSTYWHHLDSTWLVAHDGPASEIRNELARHIDSNDELLVVKLSGEGAWRGFDTKGSGWLNDNL